ncbi:MAG: signal peptidase I [Clostridiales Family XIII bacterium]|jgi:signal peptidase I|nr:signal peptidase I [Clostridiales Family XIII bacterium]
MGYTPPDLSELLAGSAADGEDLPESPQEAPAGPPHRNMRAAANVVVIGICVLIVAASVIFALSKNPDKSYFGYRFYHVMTTSMEPQPGGKAGGFHAGDIIVVKRTAPEEIRPGDIITFQPGDDARVSLTHRVVRILDEANGEEGLYFVTKGDANNAEDPPIPAEKLVGRKIFTIPKAGLVLQTIKAGAVPFSVLCGAVICFFAALTYFFKKPG